MVPFGKKTHTFPIDLVYTWVDGNDDEWLQRKRVFEASLLQKNDALLPESEDISQFRDNDELKYSLRSVAKFAPWIRTVHIITAYQRPSWLNSDAVNIVSHEEIFPTPSRTLPVFSDRPIQMCVHRIPGLAEHFIYANDDFMLGRPVAPADFFLPNGDPRIWGLKGNEKKNEFPGNEKDPSSSFSASLRAREVAKAMFGVDFPFEIGHYPKAMTIDTVRQTWDLFPEPVAKTLISPFRSSHDIAMMTLYLIFLFVTGQGKVREINKKSELLRSFYKGLPYIGTFLGDIAINDVLERIEKRRPQTFCLNDSRGAATFDRLLMRTFLEKMFPETSFFEKK